MPRQPKPWRRADRGVWCVTIAGRRHNLGPDKKAAFERYHELMAGGPPRPEPAASGERLDLLVDRFLDWTHRNRSAATYAWYRDRLQRFVDRYPDLTVDRLKPHHVEAWAADAPRSVNTRRNLMRSVKRAMKWAHAQGYLDRNPVAFLEVPSARPKEVFIPPEEFARLLARAESPRLRELLVVTYEVGCRPQESLRLEARHFDRAHARWVFPATESKTKDAPRVVYLSERAAEVTARLADAHPAGPLFRNEHGGAWTPYAVGCALQRIQLRMGREAFAERGESIPDAAVRREAARLAPTRTRGGRVVAKTAAELRCEAKRKLKARRCRELAPRYSLYALRHSWATNALRRGVDALTVAILMGHKDPSTLARTYQHLSHQPEHLLQQARRASG